MCNLEQGIYDDAYAESKLETTLEFAKKMISKKKPINEIQEFTELDSETLQKLADEIGVELVNQTSTVDSISGILNGKVSNDIDGKAIKEMRLSEQNNIQ